MSSNRQGPSRVLRVEVVGTGEILECRVGENLGHLLYSRGLIGLPCRGRGLCGECRVKVVGKTSKPTGNELKHLNAEKFRLACQTLVLGDLKVKIMSIKRLYYKLESISVDLEFKPRIKVEYLKGFKRVKCEGKVLFENLSSNFKVYGLGVDLGTSKIAYYLVDLENGELLHSGYTENPQLKYGLDVISRVEIAIKNSRTYSRMRISTLEKVESIASKLLEEVGGGVVGEAVFAGNTVMTHILLGLDLKPLSKHPYTHLVEKLDFTGLELGFKNVLKNSKVKIVPPVRGFVGGDAVSSLGVVLELKPKIPILMFDIGSNAEVALVRDGEICFTSAPAGPAIEGHVSCGTLSVKGGISKARIVGVESGRLKFEFEVLGGGEPVGITGSGLVSLICELKRWGIISSNGRILSHYERIGGVKALKVWEGESRKIYLTQLDIREFQKAKAAIAAAWKLLLKREGVKLEEIREVYIAGSFGSALNSEDLEELGITPPISRENVVFVGNAAGTGTYLSIINSEFYEKLVRISGNSKHLNLALTEEFKQAWLKSLELK